MEATGAVRAFLFALLTAIATGMGAPPFIFVKSPTRGSLRAANAVAAGLMFGASFALVYESVNYDLFRTLGEP